MSEDRRSEYPRLVGLGHIPGSARNSMADLSHASPHEVPVLSYLPVQAVPARSIALPGSDGQPGSEVATLYDPPLVMEVVPERIKRYERKTR